jgi:glycosyltransferase involved in cell wall biosynthesis
VTPSYNQGQFIRATIESVLTQDYPNIEYWVVDGGSTDNTLSILREYEHDPHFHWISERDKGQSDAINKGWSRCRGEVIAWLCSDDLYCPGAIRSQVGYLWANPDVDIVYGDALVIDVEGHDLRTYTARRFSQYELLRICFIPQVTTFLRRSLIERVGIVDPSLHYAMDYDYWLRASLRGKIAYEPRIVAKYRLHGSSKTVADSTRFFPEIDRVIDRFFEQGNVSPELRNKRNVIRADNLLMTGTAYARAGNLREAWAYLRKSLGYSWFRPRTFWFLLAILEATTHISIADGLGERWLKVRGRL